MGWVVLEVVLLCSLFVVLIDMWCVLCCVLFEFGLLCCGIVI